jgi:glycosyltransferase involved in cell wall biosynthesis
MLSNFYPPAVVGGWEQLSQEILEGLAKRKHDVMVVTSRYQRETVNDDQPHVFRDLNLEGDLEKYKPLDFFLRFKQRDSENIEILRRHVSQFQPDVILIMGMWQLNPYLAVVAEDLCPGCVAYYFCGDWPILPDIHTEYWLNIKKNSRLLQGIGELALSRIQYRAKRYPQFDHVACVSKHIREKLQGGGMKIPSARIIYNGIELDHFYVPPDHEQVGQPLRLLFAGSFSLEKGVNTVLEAMAFLSRNHSPEEIHLNLVGKGHSAIVSRLKAYCREENLERYVNFRGWVSRDQMPGILHGHDVLLFASSWEEPLARMMMEGLASGLVVVSTTTGGSKEFLIGDQNSLTFKAADATDLARQIERLLSEEGLATRIANAGQEMALREFDIGRTIEEMENFLLEAIGAKV